MWNLALSLYKHLCRNVFQVWKWTDKALVQMFNFAKFAFKFLVLKKSPSHTWGPWGPPWCSCTCGWPCRPGSCWPSSSRQGPWRSEKLVRGSASVPLDVFLLSYSARFSFVFKELAILNFRNKVNRNFYFRIEQTMNQMRGIDAECRHKPSQLSQTRMWGIYEVVDKEENLILKSANNNVFLKKTLPSGSHSKQENVSLSLKSTNNVVFNPKNTLSSRSHSKQDVCLSLSLHFYILRRRIS